MNMNPYLAQLAVAQLNGQQPTTQQLLTLQQLQQLQQAQLTGTFSSHTHTLILTFTQVNSVSEVTPTRSR